MHAENIEAAKREVLRLLGQTRKVLKDITNVPGLLREPDPKQLRQLDTDKAKEWRSTLHNEIEKVKDLEAVFAVVGTVKAGKSTAINAIVGAEILPNRPEPMTTYPTLVRHKRGQTEPVLVFPVKLAQSFNSLARKAKKKLDQKTRKNQIDELYPDPHEQEIAKKILEEKLEIVTRSEGKAEIFELLKTVNDLYRLCGRLKLDLPATANDLPTLEIEMHHIGAGDTGVGRFAVLDLPGPNEFGQGKRLREIVQTQLNRASAVVLVTDFTQRDTEADNEIQELVNKEFSQLTDRLFIFVNKFDQRRAGDWNEKKTRQSLANKLPNGTVAPERIYPVSALQAFLANWAQHQLKERGRLPAPEKSPFTRDFGRNALGIQWERSIDKYDEVKSGADALWKESLFADPLDNVIRVAARSASLVCFEAAIGKLLDCNQKIDNFLNIRDGATTEDIEGLQEAIENLQGDIGKISKKKETSEGRIKARLDEFPEIVRVGCEGWSKQLRQVIEQYLKTGKVSPPPQGRLKAKFRKALERLGQWVLELFKKPLDIPEQQTRPDFSPQQIREFRGSDHADKAQKFIKTIRTRIKFVYGKAASQIEQRLNEVSEELWNQIITDAEEELRDILEEAQERLHRGFQVTLDFPKPQLNISIEALSPLGPDVVRSSSYETTRSVKKSGIWADITRRLDIFEMGWGYEQIRDRHGSSTIDMASLQNAAMEGLEHFSSEMQSRAKDLAQSQAEAVSSYFDNLEEYLEAFRGDLLDALGDKHRKTDDLTELHNKLLGFLSEVEDVLHDTQKFKESLEASDGAERSGR